MAIKLFEDILKEAKVVDILTKNNFNSKVNPEGGDGEWPFEDDDELWIYDDDTTKIKGPNEEIDLDDDDDDWMFQDAMNNEDYKDGVCYECGKDTDFDELDNYDGLCEECAAYSETNDEDDYDPADDDISGMEDEMFGDEYDEDHDPEDHDISGTEDDFIDDDIYGDDLDD